MDLAELRERQRKMAEKRGNAPEKVIERGNAAVSAKEAATKDEPSSRSVESAKTRHDKSTVTSAHVKRTSSTLSTGSAGVKRRKRTPRTMAPLQDLSAKLDELKEERLVGANAAASTTSSSQNAGNQSSVVSGATGMSVDVGAILKERRAPEKKEEPTQVTRPVRPTIVEPRVIINPFMGHPRFTPSSSSSNSSSTPTTPSSVVLKSASTPTTPTGRKIRRPKRAPPKAHIDVDVLNQYEEERIVGQSKAVGVSVGTTSPAATTGSSVSVLPSRPAPTKSTTTAPSTTSSAPPIRPSQPHLNSKHISRTYDVSDKSDDDSTEESEDTSEDDLSDKEDAKSSSVALTRMTPPPARKITRSPSKTTIEVGKVGRTKAVFTVGPIIGCCDDSSVRILVECNTSIPLLRCKLVPLSATGTDAASAQTFTVAHRTLANTMRVFSFVNLPEATRFRVGWENIDMVTSTAQIVSTASGINSKIAFVKKYSSMAVNELKNQMPYMLIHTNLLSSSTKSALCASCQREIKQTVRGNANSGPTAFLQSAQLKQQLISIFEQAYKRALQQLEVSSVMQTYANCIVFSPPYRGSFRTDSVEYLINSAARAAYWNTARLLHMDAPETTEERIRAFLQPDSFVVHLQRKTVSSDAPCIIVLDHTVQEQFLNRPSEHKALNELDTWLRGIVDKISPTQNLTVISCGGSQRAMAEYLPTIVKSHTPFRSNVTVIAFDNGAEENTSAWESTMHFEISPCGRWIQLTDGANEPSSDLDDRNTFSLHNTKKIQGSDVFCFTQQNLL